MFRLHELQRKHDLAMREAKMPSGGSGALAHRGAGGAARQPSGSGSGSGTAAVPSELAGPAPASGSSSGGPPPQLWVLVRACRSSRLPLVLVGLVWQPTHQPATAAWFYCACNQCVGCITPCRPTEGPPEHSAEGEHDRELADIRLRRNPGF
jgi:hypothetical protein